MAFVEFEDVASDWGVVVQVDAVADTARDHADFVRADEEVA